MLFGGYCLFLLLTLSFLFLSQVKVHVDGQEVLSDRLPSLRALWEGTSFQLERLQANQLCVQQEEEGLATRTQPYFKLTFDPMEKPSNNGLGAGQPRVAVVREEGSNGDREMAVSLYMAGFEVPRTHTNTQAYIHTPNLFETPLSLCLSRYGM